MFYCIFINKFYPGLYILEISPLKVARGKICPKSDLFRWGKILKKKIAQQLEKIINLSVKK